MADDVSAVAEDSSDVLCLSVEVETPRRRTVAVALSIDEQEAKFVGELTLIDERLPARAKPAVDEDDRLALAEPEDVEISRHAGEFDLFGGGEWQLL